MMKILSGVNHLRFNYDHNVKRNERICMMCDLGEIEDSFHFVMKCPQYVDIRKQLNDRIEGRLQPSTRDHWKSLSH